MRGTGTSKTAVWRWQERFMTDGVAGLLRDKTRPSRIPPLGTSSRHASSQRRSPTHRARRRTGQPPPKLRRAASASARRNVSGAGTVCSRIGRDGSNFPTTRRRCGTMTHDYKRHGTTTLFAALNVLDGKVIGRCMQRHRHQEFIGFLNAVEAAVPVGKLVHAVADNYATHKHPKVREWLALHPRWTFHFTPTSASWLNAVEGFFAKLTRRRRKRGVLRSIVELQAAIKRFLAETNANPRPFRWTKEPDKIIAAVKRAPSVGFYPLGACPGNA